MFSLSILFSPYPSFHWRSKRCKCDSEKKKIYIYSKQRVEKEWIKKMWFIYTMEYYAAAEKNKRMPFAATWMNLEIIMRDLDRHVQFCLNAKIQQWKLLLMDISCLSSIIFALSKDTAENDWPHTLLKISVLTTQTKKSWIVSDRENIGNYSTFN